MSSDQLLARILTEAKGTSAHGMIIEYLTLKRRERLEQVSRLPSDHISLFGMQSEVRLLEEIIRDLTRDQKQVKPVKTGSYGV